MGNLGGMEILVIFIVALVVLGPSKLPEAARQVGKAVTELRRVSSGFQRELRDALEEPISETKAALREPLAETKALLDQPVIDASGDPASTGTPPSTGTAPDATAPTERAGPPTGPTDGTAPPEPAGS